MHVYMQVSPAGAQVLLSSLNSSSHLHAPQPALKQGAVLQLHHLDTRITQVLHQSSPGVLCKSDKAVRMIMTAMWLCSYCKGQ